MNIALILVAASLFGITMKIADLTDEHGLKLFKGDKYVFGTLFGIFGALMIFGDNIIANFMFAFVVHEVLRYRVDHLNHGIAGAILFIAFFINLPNFEPNMTVFFVTFGLYAIHGLLNDASDRGEIKGLWAKYFELNSHYFTVPILLTLINPLYWITIPVSVLHIVSYEITKKIASKKGYN